MPSTPSESSLGGAPTQAGLYLGSIMGSWKACSAGARDLFALGLVRRCVSTALQAEGYSFTPEQLSYWLAGAVVLDPGRPSLARPAHLVCDLVLGALARSRCEEVARAAEQFRLMAMPIVDQGEHGDVGQVHEALDAADEIVLRSRFAGGSGVPGIAERLAATAKLARSSPALATRIAEDRPFDLQGRWAMVRDEPERAAHWTLDLEIEGFFADALPGMPPLPCPGLFDRAWLRTDLDAEHHTTGDMGAAFGRLSAALAGVAALMDHAVALDREVTAARARVSAKSRLPQLVGLLGIMEQLRSSQIEAALAVTRIGVRGIIESGLELGLVRQRKGRGLTLMEPDTSRRDHPPPRSPLRRLGSERAKAELTAVDEVDDALAFAEKVLRRSGRATDQDVGDFDREDDADGDLPGWV